MRRYRINKSGTKVAVLNGGHLEAVYYLEPTPKNATEFADAETDVACSLKNAEDIPISDDLMKRVYEWAIRDLEVWVMWDEEPAAV